MMNAKVKVFGIIGGIIGIPLAIRFVFLPLFMMILLTLNSPPRRYALDLTPIDMAERQIHPTVECQFFPAYPDGRYHYYLQFEPQVEFRPRQGNRYHTLKPGRSAVGNERVEKTWKKRHYIGYLQGFDDVEEREPTQFRWESDTLCVLFSQQGIAGEFEIRRVQ